jgi:UPF0716 protein FxsA
LSKLLLLFIVVPAIELALLIEIGSRIGTLATLGLIVVTGIAGAALARSQGLRALRQLQRELQAGHLPANPLVDGAIILVAGALLLTPGFLTDVVGFLLLIPGSRRLLKAAVRRWVERAIREKRFGVPLHDGEPGWPPPPGPVRDVTPNRDQSD